MSNRMLRACRMTVLPLSGLLIATGLACTGNGATNTVLGVVANTLRTNTLMIRVVNDTTSDVEVELRVDGVMKLLPPCTALQQACDYVLTTCPQVVEVIQETRRDTNGVFMGGRNFESNPDFTFGPGEFSCGNTIILQFSDTVAYAQAI